MRHSAVGARIARAFVVVAAVLAPAGCAVGPDYARPSVIVTDGYKEAEGWKPARPRDEIPRGAWWEIFADPELSALESRVSVSNQNLAVAEAQFREARALVREARAALFPQITAGVGVSRSRSSGNVPITVGGPPGARSNYTLPLDVSWELDVWGRIRRQVESNRAAAQASAGDLETARLSVQAELAQDYFELRTLDAQKQLLEATAAVYQETLTLTQNRYASGVVSRADVLQAETQLRSTEAQAIDVGVQRAQLEHAIALLIGQPPAAFSLAEAPLAGEPPGIPAGLPSELLERRPDIAAAERRVAAANAAIGVAKAMPVRTAAGMPSTISGEAAAPNRAMTIVKMAAIVVSRIAIQTRLPTTMSRGVIGVADIAWKTFCQVSPAMIGNIDSNAAACIVVAASSPGARNWR